MVSRVDPMELVFDGSQLNGKIFGPKLVTRNGGCSMDEEPSWDDVCFMARMVLGFALTSQKWLHLHLFKMFQWINSANFKPEAWQPSKLWRLGSEVEDQRCLLMFRDVYCESQVRSTHILLPSLKSSENSVKLAVRLGFWSAKYRHILDNGPHAHWMVDPSTPVVLFSARLTQVGFPPWLPVLWFRAEWCDNELRTDAMKAEVGLGRVAESSWIDWIGTLISFMEDGKSCTLGNVRSTLGKCRFW